MGEGRNILMVEDDENDRTFFSIAIRKTGAASIQTVEDGQEAIDYLEAKGVYSNRSKYPLPDIIVLDLRMPRVNGFEFLAWRSTTQFSSLPVIVLEGSGDRQKQQSARDMGAVLAFSKPCGLEKLFELAKEIVAFDQSQTKVIFGRSLQ